MPAVLLESTRRRSLTPRQRQLAAIARSERTARSVHPAFYRAWRAISVSIANYSEHGSPLGLANEAIHALVAALGKADRLIWQSLNADVLWGHEQAVRWWLTRPRSWWLRMAREHSGRTPLPEHLQEMMKRDASRELGPAPLVASYDWSRILDMLEDDTAEEENIWDAMRAILFPPPALRTIQRIIAGVTAPYQQWRQTLAQEGFSFRRIASTIAAELAGGKAIDAVAKAIRPLVDGVYYRAARIARTESLRVIHEIDRETEQDKKTLIIGMELVGTMDDRIRPEHRQNVGPTGKRRFYKGRSVVPPLVSKQAFTVDEYGAPKTPYGTNCILPGQIVSGRFSGGIKSFYFGEAIEVVVASGKRLAVTANHPVLSEYGFVPARTLRKGDRLLFHKGNVERARTMPFDVDRAPAAIEQVFNSLVRVFSASRVNAAAGRFDFHGDEQFVYGDVDVVEANGHLLDNAESGCPQGIGDVGFMPTDTQYLAVNPSLVGNLIRGFPGDMLLDEVVDIRNYKWSGHVYDLQTAVGWYTVNGIAVHNCRCYKNKLLRGLDDPNDGGPPV